MVSEKAERLIADAAAQGSQLVVFPEAFIGGYPRGNTFGVVIGTRTPKGKEDFRKYHGSAIDVPGESPPPVSRCTLWPLLNTSQLRGSNEWTLKWRRFNGGRETNVTSGMFADACEGMILCRSGNGQACSLGGQIQTVSCHGSYRTSWGYFILHGSLL